MKTVLTDTDYSGMKVLVFDGGSRQILPILKELHDLKCNVTTFCITKLDNGYVSRYPNHRILRGDADYYDRLIMELQNGNYDVLLPLSDSTMDIVTSHYDELIKYVKIPTPDRVTFLRAYNKQETMEICMDNKIPCPITKREDQDLYDFVNQVGFPLIAKPRMANGSRGLKIVKDLKTLEELIRTKAIILDDYVIQEFIPQSGKQFNIHLFRDEKGIITSNLVTEKSRWFPVDGGASCLCRTYWDGRIAKECARLLHAVDWKSYCEIEMIVDPRDGIAKVMEINGRASASIKIMDLAGINVSQQMLQLAYGIPVETYGIQKDDIRLRCLITDVLWFIKSKDRFTRKPNWFSPIRTHDALFSLSDPVPFFAYIIKEIPKYRDEMKKRERG